MERFVWPVKTREVVEWVFDSTLWNDFEIRSDDVVVSTYPKSGTTWMLQIVSQLIFNGAPEVHGDAQTAWIESRTRPSVDKAGAQTHRRFLKTHLPLEALPYSPRAKYIYVGRDGRDVFWSWYNHFSGFQPATLARINAFPGRTGPEVLPPDPDIRVAFNAWLDTDGAPNLSYWSHARGWWGIRHAPNLLMVHYANLKSDLDGEVRRIARFLDIEIDPGTWPAILEHCSFAYMRQQAAQQEYYDHIFVGGGGTFVNKGTNGRWRDVLTAADIERFENLAERNLPPTCRHWLETGELSEAQEARRAD